MKIMFLLMFFLNIAMMVALFIGVVRYLKRGTELQKVLDALERSQWATVSDWEIEKIVVENMGKNASKHLDGLVAKTEQDIIDRKSIERIEIVVDEWCEKFTAENYDQLLKEKLKIGVKDRLEEGFCIPPQDRINTY